MKLDLGCGNSKPDGPEWIGIDRVSTEDADIVRDLEEDPSLEGLGLEGCSKVRAGHFLEHLSEESLDQLLEEVHRVLKDDGVFEVTVPHFLSWNSATVDHRQMFGRNSFDLYTDHSFANQRPSLFEIEDVEFVLEMELNLVRYLSKIFSSRTIATYVPNSVREVKFKLRPIGRGDSDE